MPDLLSIFAAAGYITCNLSPTLLLHVSVSLQQISNLEETHHLILDVYWKFGIGFHVVRRSHQCWAGLGRDLVIEQTLMMFFICGSGMTDEMQTPWTLSATSEHNSAMQDFTDLTYTTSPQHKDSTEACIKGDSSDLEKMQTQITTCSPYTADPTLRNMVNGIVAGSRCECSCNWGDWENDHKRYHMESRSLLINSRENTEPKLLEIAWLLRSLLTVLFILLFCSSVFWWCQNLEILPLQSYLSYELSSHPASSLKPKTYFVQQIRIRSLRQFESML